MKRVLTVLLLGFTVSAQASWLDDPQWQSKSLSSQAIPSAPRYIADYFKRCDGITRDSMTVQEGLLQAEGWYLYGTTLIVNDISILMGLASFDAVCHPMQYQAFVFRDTTFLGTLSPVVMNTGEDGALITTDLSSESTITATFNRYTPADSSASLSPSATSTVDYVIKDDDLMTTSITTLPWYPK